MLPGWIVTYASFLPIPTLYMEVSVLVHVCSVRHCAESILPMNLPQYLKGIRQISFGMDSGL